MTYSKGLRISGPSQNGGGLIGDGGDYAIVEPGGIIVGEAFHHISAYVWRDAEANAQLWAAAPELLDTLMVSAVLLKRLRGCNRDFINEIDEILEQSHDAIAKAKGKTPEQGNCLTCGELVPQGCCTCGPQRRLG